MFYLTTSSTGTTSLLGKEQLASVRASVGVSTTRTSTRALFYHYFYYLWMVFVTSINILPTSCCCSKSLHKSLSNIRFVPISQQQRFHIATGLTDSSIQSYRTLAHLCSTASFLPKPTQQQPTRITMSSSSSSSVNQEQHQTEYQSTNTVSVLWDTHVNFRDEAIKQCILPLTSTSYKGSSGRVAIFGGSEKYTGAPYYTAMAALQTGADLVYVLTALEASVPIKCYSPELMVAPVYTVAEFDAAVQNDPTLQSIQCTDLIDKFVCTVLSNIQNIHCFIIGPGMGRCPLVMKATSQIIHHIRQRNIPIIVDADALYMLSLTEYRTILQGYHRAVITPNAMEYKRLFDSNDANSSPDNYLENVTIVQKGQVDQVIVNGQVMYTCNEMGGLKRSGGIGDILAGTIGTLVAWNQIMYHSVNHKDGNSNNTSLSSMSSSSLSLVSLAAWTACCFVKHSTNVAYQNKHRSMTAPDILNVLGATIHSMITKP